MVVYPALFEPDEEAGGFVVTFPDLPHGVTQGKDLEEATEMAADLLACLIIDVMEKREGVPAPSTRRGKKYRLIGLPALQSAKVDLYTAFLESGLKKAEFARRIGIPKTHIDRLFSLRHRSRLDQIEAALGALSKHLYLEVRDAA